MSIKHAFTPSSRAVKALIVSMALIVSAKDCKPQGGSTGLSKEGPCLITNVEKPTAYTPPGAEQPWVQASVTITCSPAPATSRTVLYLYRRSPETGKDIRLWTTKPDTVIPSTTGRTFAAVYPFCEAGSWYMRITIKGAMQDGTPYSVNAPSKRSQVVC